MYNSFLQKQIIFCFFCTYLKPEISETITPTDFFILSRVKKPPLTKKTITYHFNRKLKKCQQKMIRNRFGGVLLAAEM